MSISGATPFSTKNSIDLQYFDYITRHAFHFGGKIGFEMLRFRNPCQYLFRASRFCGNGIAMKVWFAAIGDSTLYHFPFKWYVSNDAAEASVLVMGINYRGD